MATSLHYEENGVSVPVRLSTTDLEEMVELIRAADLLGMRWSVESEDLSTPTGDPDGERHLTRLFTIDLGTGPREEEE